MIDENFSDADELDQFNKAMKRALNAGSMCPFGIGIGGEVMREINNVAQAFPKATKAQIKKAEEAFAAQGPRNA